MSQIHWHGRRLYHVFRRGPRDVELLPGERGVIVSYKAVWRW
jgi:hypothetical protein